MEAQNPESFTEHVSISGTLQIENEIYIKSLIARLPITYKEIIIDYYYKQV